MNTPSKKLSLKSTPAPIFLLLFFVVLVLKWDAIPSPYFEDEKFWWIPSALWVSEHYPSPVIREGLPEEIRDVPAKRIPDHSYRIPDFGHPPLFFLIYGTAFLAGHSRVAAHLITLLLVAVILYFTYLMGRRLLDGWTGLLSALALMITPPFMAGAGRCELDVPMTAFAMGALYHAVSRRYRLYLLFASLALLTKETGVLVVLPAALLFSADTLRKRGPRGAVMASLPVILPFVPYLLYLLLHRFQAGWWLYTARYYNLSLPVYLYSLLIALKFIIFDQGRFLLSIPMAGYLVYRLFKGWEEGEERTTLFLLSIPFLHAVVLSFVDFRVLWAGGEEHYTHVRYFLPAFPPLFVVSACYIRREARRWWFLTLLTLLFISISTLSFHRRPRLGIEENLHYLDLIQAEREGIRFLEEMKEGGTIWADPSLYLDLKFPYAGFVERPMEGVRLLGKDPPGDGMKVGDLVLEASYGHPLHEVRKFFKLRKVFDAKVHEARFTVYLVYTKDTPLPLRSGKSRALRGGGYPRLQMRGGCSRDPSKRTSSPLPQG